jgi:hypothetical protein
MLCGVCAGVPVLQDAADIRQQCHASQRLPDVRVQHPGFHNTHSGLQVRPLVTCLYALCQTSRVAGVTGAVTGTSQRP